MFSRDVCVINRAGKRWTLCYDSESRHFIFAVVMAQGSISAPRSIREVRALRDRIERFLRTEYLILEMRDAWADPVVLDRDELALTLAILEGLLGSIALKPPRTLPLFGADRSI